MFLILNVAVGGTLGGTVPNEFSAADMLIDYVHFTPRKRYACNAI
jgi:hypothetical protein